MVQTHKGLQQDRYLTIAGGPVIGDPCRRTPHNRRSQLRHPHPGKKKKTMIAHNPADMGQPGIR